MAKFNREEVLKFHQGGKVAVTLPKPLKTKDDLCLAYIGISVYKTYKSSDNSSYYCRILLAFFVKEKRNYFIDVTALKVSDLFFCKSVLNTELFDNGIKLIHLNNIVINKCLNKC